MENAQRSKPWRRPREPFSLGGAKAQFSRFAEKEIFIHLELSGLPLYSDPGIQ